MYFINLICLDNVNIVNIVNYCRLSYIFIILKLFVGLYIVNVANYFIYFYNTLVYEH